MTLKQSEYMRKAITYYSYDGRKPKGVSIARWNAMVKFIQKHFPELR